MTAPGADRARWPRIEPLMAISEVSDVLGISESGVYRIVRRGELAAVKVGGSTRFEPAAVRDFISARRLLRADTSQSQQDRREEAA